MNIAKGEAGTCNGDSGGPIFYEDQDLGRVQVSLVSGGDAVCRATNTGPGFSRQEALDFIACGKVDGDAALSRLVSIASSDHSIGIELEETLLHGVKQFVTRRAPALSGALLKTLSSLILHREI